MFAEYKLPSAKIVDIFDTPKNPYWNYRSFSKIALEKQYRHYQTLQQLADPKVKLAGQEISIKLNAEMDAYPDTSLIIHNLQTGKTVKPQFQGDIEISRTLLSPDESKVAVITQTDSGLKLLLVETETGKVRVVPNITLNNGFSNSCVTWFANSESLLLKAIPPGRGQMPQKQLPSGPITEESSGKFSKSRTYQNLLQNKHDELLFDYFFTSQLVELNLADMSSRSLGEPAIIYDYDISPDDNYILLETLHQPYSYELPYYRFPKKTEIWNRNGRVVHTVYNRPLQDEVPIGGTYTGPRYFEWQPLQPATLIYKEALDEGNPEVDVPYRDRVMRLQAPFDAEPQELYKTEHRHSYVRWSEQEDELIAYEYDRDKLWVRGWLIDLKTGSRKLFHDLSVNDEYNDPGRMVTRTTASGNQVFIKKDGFVYTVNNTGATPDGNFPFFAKINIESGEKEILYRCEGEKYDVIYGVIDENMNKLMLRSESTSEPRNFFILNLDTNKQQELSEYANPYPEVTNLKKELVKYEREDGVQLFGTLYLPAKYDGKEKLPLIIHAYPEEFANTATANQVSSSPNRFPRFWGSSIKYLVLEGYAVLANASIPIVGNPETVNETFIDQTLSSVEAAIDFLDDRQIIDRGKVGIYGHSYGAFMVANVLAHSDLCAAGIARSGAYNRTLTPFGFQSERRTLWEARDFYVNVSPFMFANKIKEPLLLVHGENDPNSGTYPLQTKRMYQALKGNGGTVRMVLLPLEGHGYRARSSNLHVLAEMIEWFDRYLK
jgi:dipeptidyl aminopeptidase/acylaminoacyl peptidase